ncbi:MAG: transporter related [Lachnospiraceae bacterium]|jgi:putative ABC transport system ATP-binding protein|nr:transporter related [Lachnospiraceae bacterium]MDF2845302.1 transporter related [Herbinix sp.]
MFTLKNLTMIYDMDKADKVYALKELNLELPQQGFIGIIGPSGSGKSSLMYCLSTLKNPTSGEIIYNKKSYAAFKSSEKEVLRRKEFGFVFQRHFLISYMSALDNVIVAATGNSESARRKGTSLLEDFGLKSGDIKKRPSKLSGGQRQRVAIARALVNEPTVLFADEPTASLDHDTAFMVVDVLKKYAKDHLVLVITHDHSILKDADQIIEMWDGEISRIQNVPKREDVHEVL